MSNLAAIASVMVGGSGAAWLWALPDMRRRRTKTSATRRFGCRSCGIPLLTFTSDQFEAHQEAVHGIHRGATAGWSPAEEVNAVGPGQLREDEHEDIQDLDIDAGRMSAERAERGTANLDDVEVDPDVRKELKAALAPAIAAFADAMDAISNRLNADPEARYQSLTALEHTQEIPISAITRRLRTPLPARERFEQLALPAGSAAA